MPRTTEDTKESSSSVACVLAGQSSARLEEGDRGDSGGLLRSRLEASDLRVQAAEYGSTTKVRCEGDERHSMMGRRLQQKVSDAVK